MCLVLSKALYYTLRNRQHKRREIRADRGWEWWDSNYNHGWAPHALAPCTEELSLSSQSEAMCGP